MIRAQWGIVGLTATLLVAWGCEGGGGRPSVSSSMEEATVKGTVTVKGTPVTKGMITFDPANVDRKVGPRTAEIGSDGTYTIKTLIGQNRVNVTGPTIARDPNLAMNESTVEVQSGDNQIPIELAPTSP